MAPDINQWPAAAAEAEKVWEYTTKIGGRGRSESDADVCMRNWLSGMVSAALGQFPCPTRKYIALPAKCTYWKSKDIHIQVGIYSTRSGISHTELGIKINCIPVQKKILWSIGVNIKTHSNLLRTISRDFCVAR